MCLHSYAFFLLSSLNDFNLTHDSFRILGYGANDVIPVASDKVNRNANGKALKRGQWPVDAHGGCRNTNENNSTRSKRSERSIG